MSVSYEIHLANQAGELIPASLECESRYWSEGGFSRRDCCIKLRYRDSEIESIAVDYFAAFCEIREQLWNVGMVPLCYGASRNVYPSGMSRDMSEGCAGYKLQIGQHAKETMFIFDTGPDVDPVSVEAQKEFYERWLNTPRQ